MANITIDTTKTKEKAQQLADLAKKYNSLINELFDCMNFSISKSWSGAFAENYKKAIMSDKEVFLSYSKYLALYAYELDKIANTFQTELLKQRNNK